MKVACVGSGYVGCLTSAAFAAVGHSTTVIDVDRNKVDQINSGKCPIYEPGLEKLLERHAGTTLRASTTYEAVSEADVVIICVGTPSRANGSADLNHIRLAARSIGEHLNRQGYTVVVNKSTVPVGTTDIVARLIEEASGLAVDRHFSVVSNPEFLREGFAVEDVFFPERIVVGTGSAEAGRIMRELYRPMLERKGYADLADFIGAFPEGSRPVPVYFETDTKTAELVKYASNAFLAVKISYINEIARLCDSLGADVRHVADGMGLDSRIGGKFLQASSGWSGSCFPKDTAELIHTGLKYESPLLVVEAAVESNGKMHDYCVGKLRSALKSLNGKTVGILGLTFKPGTDDARSTQASVILRKLSDLGAFLQAHDPQGMDMFRMLNGDIPVRYCANAEETARNADAVVLLTHWEEYAGLDWGRLAQTMKNRYILDTRNFLDADGLTSLGFHYEGLGIRVNKQRVGSL